MTNDTSKSFIVIFDEYNESMAVFAHTLVAQNWLCLILLPTKYALSYASCMNEPIKRAGVLHVKPPNNRNLKGITKSHVECS